MPSCVFPGCKNHERNTKGTAVSYHRFPRHIYLKQIWLRACHLGNEFSVKDSRVCSEHFDDSDFVRDLRAEIMNLKARRVLKSTAVPRKGMSNVTFFPRICSEPFSASCKSKTLQQRILGYSPHKCMRNLTKEVVLTESPRYGSEQGISFNGKKVAIGVTKISLKDSHKMGSSERGNDSVKITTVKEKLKKLKKENRTLKERITSGRISGQKRSAASSSSKDSEGNSEVKPKKKKGRPKKVYAEESKALESDYAEEDGPQEPIEMVEIEEPVIKQEVLDIYDNELKNAEDYSGEECSQNEVPFETIYFPSATKKMESQEYYESPSSFTVQTHNDSETLVPEFLHKEIKVEPADMEAEETLCDEGLDDFPLMWRCPLVSCPERFSAELEMYEHLNLSHVVKGLALTSKSKKCSRFNVSHTVVSSNNKELPKGISAASSSTSTTSSPVPWPAATSRSSGLVVFQTAPSQICPATVSSSLLTTVPTSSSVPSSCSGPVTITTTLSYSSLPISSTPLVTSTSRSSVTSISCASVIPPVSSCPSSPPEVSSVTLPSKTYSRYQSLSPALRPESSPTSDHSTSSNVSTTATPNVASHSPSNFPAVSAPQGTTKFIVAPISDSGSSSSGPKKFLLLAQKQSKNESTKPSQPQTLQILQSPERMIEDLPPCATDDSEMFSISLARIAADRRVPLKRKLVEIVDSIGKKKLHPDKLVIAYYSNNPDSRTV